MKMTTKSNNETVPTEMLGPSERDNFSDRTHDEETTIDWESFSDVNPNVQALLEYWKHRHDRTVSYGGQKIESDLGFHTDLKNQYLPFLTPIQTEFEENPEVRSGALSTAPLAGYASHICAQRSSEESDKKQMVPPVDEEAKNYNMRIQQAIKEEKEFLLWFKKEYTKKGYHDWDSFCREIAAKSCKPELYSRSVKLAEVAAPFRDRIQDQFFVALEKFCAPARLDGIRSGKSTDVVHIYQIATIALFAHALNLNFDVSNRWNDDSENVMADFWAKFVEYLHKQQKSFSSIPMTAKGYVIQPHAEMPAPSKYLPTGYFNDLTKIGTENLQTLISSVRLNLPEVEGQQVLWAAQTFSIRGLTHACLTVPYMKLLFYYNTRFARGDYTSGTSPGIWTNLTETEFVKGVWWPLSQISQTVWPVFQGRIVTLADLCSYMAGKMGVTPGYEPERLGKDVAVIPVTKRMQFDMTWWVTAFMEYPLNDFTHFITMNRMDNNEEVDCGWGRPLTSATRIVGPATRALFVLVDELGGTSISKGSRGGHISSTFSIDVWGATVSAQHNYLFGTDQVPTPLTPSLDDFNKVPPLVAAITYMEGIISREDAELARDLLAAFSHLHTVAAFTELTGASRYRIRSPGQANLIGAQINQDYNRPMTPDNGEFCTGNHLVNAFKMYAISREDQIKLRQIHMCVPDGFWMANLFAFGGYIKAENSLTIPWHNFYPRLAVNSVALCHLNDMIDMKAGSTCLTLCPYMITQYVGEYSDMEEYISLVQTRNTILPQIHLPVNYEYTGTLRDSYVYGFQNTYICTGRSETHLYLGRPICYPLQISVLFGSDFKLGSLDSSIRAVKIFSEYRRTYGNYGTLMGYRPDMSEGFANESRYWKQAYAALGQIRRLPTWLDPSGREWKLSNCCHLFLQAEAQRRTFSIPNTNGIHKMSEYLRPFYEPDLTYHLEWHSNPTYWWGKTEFQSIIWGNVNNKNYVLIKPVRSIPYHVASLIDQQNRPSFLFRSKPKLNF